MRPIEEWSDKVYAPGTAVGHVKPFGEARALCGEMTDETWFGTGCWDEMERAERLPICTACNQKLKEKVQPLNEFTAPMPLYAHCIPEDN